jgi:hypothetical protein
LRAVLRFSSVLMAFPVPGGLCGRPNMTSADDVSPAEV